MRSPFVKRLGWGAALLAGLASAFVFGHGGVREAWAVVQLDGWHAIPYSPPDWSTCYASSFTQDRFLRVEPGDSAASVRSTLGEPLDITWYDDAVRGPWITFEPVQGRWVVTSADGIAVSPGTSMASLEGRRAAMHEYWRYSRYCASEQSARLRNLELRGGRVVRRNASVIYD